VARGIPVITRAAVVAVLAVGGDSAIVQTALAQSVLELAAHPGVAYAFGMENGSLGGWVGFGVARTENVAVGGEIGYFTGGNRHSSIQTDDPVFGRVIVSEHREERFWFVRCVAGYRLPQVGKLEAQAVLGTGFYQFRQRLVTEERTPEGVPVRAGVRSWQSISHHPGASVGLELGRKVSPEGWLLLGHVGLHVILGAGGGFYPVLVGSVGIAKRI
jgi:hypothetical protein